jgi:hypothetical protein
LNAGFILENFQLVLEIAAALRADDIGLIDHASSQRRKIERKGGSYCKTKDERTTL